MKKWLKSLLGNEPSAPAPPPRVPTLADLRAGDLVDFDLESWEVAAHSRVEYGEGPGRVRWADDWELRAGTRAVRLHRDVIGGDVYLSVLRPLPLQEIDSAVRDEIIQAGDPPAQIYVRGEPFFRDHESFAGFFHRADGSTDGLIYWIYRGVTDGAELRIEQVGEYTVRVAIREAVDEYQFSNFLPGA